MNNLIKNDFDASQINLDHDRPADLVQISGNVIKRTVIKPKYLLDQQSDYLKNLTPTVCLLENSLESNAPLLSREQLFDSNRRLKLGKVNLSIPEFAVSRVIGFNGGHNQFSPLKRLPYLKVNDSHRDLVVGEINVRQRDEFSEGELTFSLRNKGVKAKDIQKILSALVYHYGALKIVESTHTESPSVGRKPSKKYQVLWGASKFFPQPPESKEDQE